MDCSLPPPLTADQLSAAIDDDVAPSVIEHLARCASCAARLADAQQTEQALRSNLYRWDCPSPQVLADYHVGRVGTDADRAIRLHLPQCAHCREEIEMLRLFMLDEESEVQPALRVPAQPARRRPVAGAPTRGWSLARLLPRAAMPALRGAAAGPLMFEADGGVTVFLDAQPGAADQVALHGQLVADDQEHWTGALVEVRQAGTLRATASIDDMGGFSCDSLAALATELRITRPDGRMLLLPEFDLASG
jgi:hypothetical protein